VQIKRQLSNHSSTYNLCFLFSFCERVQVYAEHESPEYIENVCSNSSDEIDLTITLVSFNIENSLKIVLAIEENKIGSSFNISEIILLQEVDKKSVVNFSKQFSLNSLYYLIALIDQTRVNMDMQC